MKKFLDFIESYCLEGRQYWQVPDVYGRSELEIQFSRDGRGKSSWQIRPKNEGEWESIEATAEFLTTLAKFKVDISNFESQLGRSILTHAIFANQIVKSAKELMGEKAVDEAFRDNDRFMSDLFNAIQSVLGNKKTGGESTSSGAQSSSPESAVEQRPSLRVVSQQESPKA